MKKNFYKMIAVVFVCVALCTVFAGCVNLSEEEKEVVGKYELVAVSISGLPSISKDSYDYFRIEFKSNKKCTVESKAGISTYGPVEASWKINSDGEVEVITKQGFAKAVELYTYKDGILTGTNTSVIEGTSYTMTVTFEKVVEEEST